MEIDFTEVARDLLLDEREQNEDEPNWLPALRRSINGLHHSLAALHRKADHMSKVGDELTESIATLEANDVALEGAVVDIAGEVTGAAAAFKALDTHIEDLVNGGVLTAEQATALQARTDAVGTKLAGATDAITAAANSLGGDAAAAEAAGGVGSGAAASGGTASGAGAGAGEGLKADEKPFYNFTDDPSQIRLDLWTKVTTRQGQGGVALYTFNQDVAGQAPTGVGNGWDLWTGATEPITPAGA